MAIVLRAKTIFIAILLIMGLVFLVLGFSGESWFKTEPASTTQANHQDQIIKVDDARKKVEALLPQEESKPVEKMDGVKFFAEYRLERDRTRSQQVEILKEIIHHNKTNEETRDEAQKKLMKLTSNLEKEVEIENLIRAKNFSDAVVFIQDSSVTVIVLVKDLSQQDTALISQLVTGSTGISKENIVIIPKS